jgi:predicted transcriptional regulator
MKPPLLGSLESRIMQFFWNSPGFRSISELQLSINRKSNLAYTTISTVVGRLVDKDLLTRTKSGRGFLYCATVSEEKFRESYSRKLIRNLLGNFGDLAIAGFVDELRSDPKSLQKLRELSGER